VDSARAYHHGNLREALLDAAAALVAEAGPGAFTLREVARRVGVSHNAPYRHFHDRDELLAAVAAQGFERLTAAMKRSAAKGTGSLGHLRLCGRGYIEFALRWPEHFLVMFDLPSCSERYPDYAAAGEEAFQVLLAGIADAQNAGALPAGDPQPLALVAWSVVHGIAKLAIARRLPFGSARVLEFADYAERTMVQGMASLPHPGAIPAK
jgi:AcrR family transcriptional regulator